MLHLRPSTLFFRRTVMTLCLLLPAACTADTTSAPASAPATKPATGPATRVLESPPFPVAFESTDMTIKGKPFTVEIAKSDIQVQRGLMYRDSMPADRGMLFIMSAYEKTNFWMKNTRIPLDIIFLDKTGKVIDIHDRKPFDELGMGPDVPVQYVIELNEGMSQKIGLKKGDTVEIPAKYAKN